MSIKYIWEDAEEMKAQKTVIVFVFLCLILSLAVTIASFNISYRKHNILDAAIVYRGWPLYWMIESWSYWSRPPYAHTFNFRPLNFLVDFAFWVIVFQIPMQLYFYLKKRKRFQSKI